MQNHVKEAIAAKNKAGELDALFFGSEDEVELSDASQSAPGAATSKAG